MKGNILFSLALVIICGLSLDINAQNYNSTGDGNWETASNWTNTSNWGNAFPSTTGSSGTRNLNHNQTVNGNYSTASSTLNVGVNKTMTVTGDFASGGGSTTNVYGTLVVEGDMTLSSLVRVYPGGQLIVKNALQVNSSNNLVIGTNAAPPQYADMILYGDLNSNNSGDVTINQNGRVAVFGNVNDNGGGGTFLQVNNGGQMYVHGDISYSGGGSSIQNNNSTDPYGLYVNGDVNNTGGGSSTTTNRGDQQDMIDTNPDFTDWISQQENSPLPIVLTSFTVSAEGELNWSTAKEENFSHFEIQRAVGDGSFEAIGTVNGNGDSKVDQYYSFMDYALPYGKLYYRLKSIDIDGVYEYSPVISLERSFNGQIAVFPNPTSQLSAISIQLPVDFQQEISLISVYNLNGTLVKEFRNVNPVKGLGSNLHLESGVYVLKVSHEGIEENLRLMIN